MKKYVVIDESRDGMGNTEIKVFDTLEEARTAGSTAWAYLTPLEQKKRKVTVADVTEEDLADYAFDDGKTDWTCFESCGHEVCEEMSEC